MSAYLVGYSALIEKFNLNVPLHHEMAAISPKNIRRKEDGWVIYPNAFRSSNSTIDHLVFALKHEGVSFLTLAHVFKKFDKKELEKAAIAKPTSAYIRRLCFFYEWLGNGELYIQAVTAGAYVEAIDTKQQYAAKEYFNEKRFRIRDNIPGTRLFCPTVFKTHKIDEFINLRLSSKAKAIVSSAPRELIARAAAFLLLSDSKASFAIEGEHPPKSRIARWGNVISKAGQIELTTSKLIELQKELIGDDRLVRVGLRDEGGFVGRHDAFGHPEPEHISANAKDLNGLLRGVEHFNSISKILEFHPVLAAACIAFGFVYIHPFEDGNGRIHRFLLHHVLAEFGYTPKEIVFPISSVILDDIARYKDTLEIISRPLLELIEWKSTDRGNIEVQMETSDYYRYFDATAHCEYLFKCIQRSVEKELPEELSFLEHRDEFHREVTEIVDMGERTIDLMLRFLRQGHGVFSKRAREGEFSLLTPSEIERVQDLYIEIFGS
ncbi:Fic family protein [Methylobacterium sp. J-076]|uniref:Fic family protein n=1 Tax=Methylobacterium sp. J-076 TaxID=2836655 RepID=UPI001FBBE6AF|nr:Fic family protein [Methylobacterium sp. J-076]MCJ2010924.1 Fic family protein [Methylobacterium sp. J-076]